jgi:hypothetical protein
MIIAGIGIPTPMRPRGDGLPFIMVDGFVNGLSWWSTVIAGAQIADLPLWCAFRTQVEQYGRMKVSEKGAVSIYGMGPTGRPTLNLGARAIPPTNERRLLHPWHDRDNPSSWAARSIFLDGANYAEKS